MKINDQRASNIAMQPVNAGCGIWMKGLLESLVQHASPA